MEKYGKMKAQTSSNVDQLKVQKLIFIFFNFWCLKLLYDHQISCPLAESQGLEVK